MRNAIYRFGKSIPDAELFFQESLYQCSLLALIAHSSPQNLLTCHLIYQQGLMAASAWVSLRHLDDCTAYGEREQSRKERGCCKQFGERRERS
jgi:hypothetical protein